MQDDESENLCLAEPYASEDLKRIEDVSEQQFEHMWTLIESHLGMHKATLVSEKKAIDVIIHSHAIACESMHKNALNLHQSYEVVQVLNPRKPETQLSHSRTIASCGTLNTKDNDPSPGDRSTSMTLPGKSHVWINNIWYIVNTPEGQLGTARIGNPNGVSEECIRRSIDLPLARIERRLKAALQDFNVNPAEAAAAATLQLELLVTYMQAARNRIAAQQGVDGLMDVLLQLKCKMLELAHQKSKKT